MGVPTSEVGYTPAMPRREDHEVHNGHVVALDQKKRKQTLHCVIDDSLGDSDSGEYSGFLNARLHTLKTNLQQKHQT
jgi:hypothetical protein